MVSDAKVTVKINSRDTAKTTVECDNQKNDGCDCNAEYGNIWINCIHLPKYRTLGGKLQKRNYCYINLGTRLMSTKRLIYFNNTIT